MCNSHDQTRRAFITSVLGSILATGFRCSFAKEAAAGGGCVLSEAEFESSITLADEALLRSIKNFNVASTPIFNRSGNSEFDQAFGRQLRQMANTFGFRPGFGYYQDGSSPNAVATPFRRFPNTDGTVAFGLQLLDMCLKTRGGEVTALTIAAHEWGHIMQFNQGYRQRITQRFPAYCMELHADYLAGFYLSEYRSKNPRANLQLVGSTWSQMGSGRFNDPGSHGTNQQRVDAIEGGFRYRKRNPSASPRDAAEVGLSFVSKLI